MVNVNISVPGSWKYISALYMKDAGGFEPSHAFWTQKRIIKILGIFLAQLMIHNELGSCKLQHLSHCCYSKYTDSHFPMSLIHWCLWLSNGKSSACGLTKGLSACIWEEPILQVEIRNIPRRESLPTQTSVQRHSAPIDSNPSHQDFSLNRRLLSKTFLCCRALQMPYT